MGVSDERMNKRGTSGSNKSYEENKAWIMTGVTVVNWIYVATFDRTGKDFPGRDGLP